MIETAPDAAPETLARYHALIDARSPAEFAEDHIPGAINLPVLSNDERAEVGTVYKQQSRFDARRIGAAYVARNVAHHLETALAARDGDFRPLVYCWRGGMRSGAMATILAQVGWRVGVLAGGYRTWRREVVAGLREDGAPLKLVLLDGQTGTAKTAILHRAARLGVQTLDLEGAARHRGSVFGGYEDAPQPTQKAFESALWMRLRDFDLTRPILVEAESSMIGRCEIPQRLWRAMRTAPAIDIAAPLDTRADWLTRSYADIIANGVRVAAAIDRLKPFAGKAQCAEWRALADARDYESLARGLMAVHYDPLYDRARARRENAGVLSIKLDDFDDASLDTAARAIAQQIAD